MHDEQKTKQQLIDELAQMRSRVAEYETQLASSQRVAADQKQVNNSLPILVATAGIGGYYKEVNPAFERILGWTEQESLSRPFMEFIHPDDRAAAIETFERLKSGEPITDFLDRNVCKDGSYRWISWTVIPVPSRDIVYGIGQDITKRKHAELELRNARAQLEQRVAERTAELIKANEELRIFQTFAETSAEGFGMTDMDGKIVYGNAALARLVGETKPENAFRNPPSTYYTDDYQELQETEIFPNLEMDGIWRGELTMVSVTGERIPVLQTSFTLIGATGNPVRRGVVITDLRKIKEAEVVLQESLTELQAIYDGMIDGLVLVDLVTMRFLRANSAFCEMLGYSHDELLSLTVHEVHPPESLPRVDEAVRDLAKGRPAWAADMPVLRKNGSIFQADVSVTAISIGGLQYAISFFRDITQRLKDEKERKRTEARYRALVEASPDAIIMCDLDGRITFASPQAAERHGVEDVAELIGLLAVDLVVQQERELMQLNIHRLLESGLRRNDQYTGLRKNGTTFFAEVSGAIINDAKGQPECFVAVYRDITERKEAQESLYRMLQTSDRERELIAYDIHDGVAQQLLGALMHFEAFQQLDNRVAKKEILRFEEGLKALRKATSEARSLINRTRTPVLEEFGVRSAIADFIDQLTHRANTPEIIYLCEARFERLEPVLENAIFRVAQEAISNACKHSKSEMIRVRLAEGNDEVTIEVQDTGIGFDAAIVRQDRFGLHGIQERVRLLGKHLTIESAPGQGTRIQATFPLIYRKEETR